MCCVILRCVSNLSRFICPPVCLFMKEISAFFPPQSHGPAKKQNKKKTKNKKAWLVLLLSRQLHINTRPHHSTSSFLLQHLHSSYCKSTALIFSSLSFSFVFFRIISSIHPPPTPSPPNRSRYKPLLCQYYLTHLTRSKKKKKKPELHTTITFINPLVLSLPLFSL